MKLLLVVSALASGSVALANPVTKNTDIGKRDVKSHKQVTRCNDADGYDCKINSVTEFDKPVKKKKVYFGECNYSEDGNLRAEECVTSKTKRKPKVVTKTVVKEKTVDNTKNNRVQLHVGAGPDGFDVKETNEETTVEQSTSLLLGLQYTRRLNSDWNVGGSLFSNKSLTLSVGLDF